MSKRDAAWNRCDACGRYIPLDDFANGRATRRMLAADSQFTSEEWENQCSRCRERNAALSQ